MPMCFRSEPEFNIGNEVFCRLLGLKFLSSDLQRGVGRGYFSFQQLGLSSIRGWLEECSLEVLWYFF